MESCDCLRYVLIKGSRAWSVPGVSLVPIPRVGGLRFHAGRFKFLTTLLHPSGGICIYHLQKGACHALHVYILHTYILGRRKGRERGGGSEDPSFFGSNLIIFYMKY